MYIPEKGVLENSSFFFHTPSNTARSVFYYMTCAGEFFCDSDYYVERETFHSYLIMYIKSGNGFVSVNNRLQPVKSNDVVFLNCHRHHIYYTDSGWETLWLHFDGNSSKEFHELLNNRFESVLDICESLVIPRLLSMIIDGYKCRKSLPEALVSSYIHRMLSELLMISSNMQKLSEEKMSLVLEAVTFIQSNYMEKLTVPQLADYVNMSLFHFSRVFKKETGYAPYEYIIKTRIDHAKGLLKKSNKNVKEIAYEVGFNSESNFVNTFRDSVKLTPNEFRRTPI